MVSKLILGHYCPVANALWKIQRNIIKQREIILEINIFERLLYFLYTYNGPFLTVNQSMLTEVDVVNQ